MNVSPARAVFVLAVLSITNASAAPDAVATAKSRLDAATEKLAKAVKQIEKDPPSNADLDAALEAVGALKEAIDGGAEFESKDLDYAKAMLAARKQLRTQRDYVEERRAKVHIFSARRSVDAAIATMNDRLARTERKEASAKDFDEARQAAAELKKALETGRPFVKQDQGFAKFVTDTDAAVARQEKLIEDRWTLKAVDAHRARAEESRQALAAAMAALSKGGSDAQFEAADRAATVVSKVLEEGKAFEARDKAYAAVADRARADIADAKKKMEQLLSTTALERLKSEVEPANKDLAGALKAIRARKPTDDQLAEAKTAAIVVRKLVEKFQPQASRSPPFAQYLNTVKATLVEVESELLRRNLESVRGDLVKALKGIERRDATDEQFAEVNTAITILEKTLEGVQKVDPAVAPTVAEARTLAKDAKSTLAKRRGEIDSEAVRKKVDSARVDVVKALRAIERRDATDEQFGEVNTAITVLEKTLEDVKKVDPAVAPTVQEARAMVKDAKASMAKRRGEVDLQRQRAKVQEARKSTEEVVRQIQSPSPSEEQLKAAEDAVKQLGEVLAEGAPFTKKDHDYFQYDKDVKTRITELNERIAKRRLGVAVSAARAKLTETMADAKTKLETASKPESTEADLDAATKSVEALTKAIEGNAALEKQDGSYVAHAERARNELMRQSEALEMAKAAGLARRQTGVVLAAGEVAAKAAGEAKDLRQQKKQYDAAISQFKTCEQDGKSLLRENPVLAKVIANVEGRPLPIKDVVALCSERLKAMEQPLRQAASMLAFQDGPKKAFETAKNLASRSKRAEAIPQFDECIVQAGKVRFDYPELKEKKFEVAGASLTLTEMIKECFAQRDALKK